MLRGCEVTAEVVGSVVWCNCAKRRVGGKAGAEELVVGRLHIVEILERTKMSMTFAHSALI